VLKPAELRIVPVASVRPHEIADPARKQRIEARLRADNLLRDPLIVGAVPDIDGYVLLDGTNRRQALIDMALPHVMVQVIDYADSLAVELRTWCHAARVRLTEILDGAAAISGVIVSTLSPLEVQDALAMPGTLAVLLDGRQRYVLTRDPSRSQDPQGTARADQLCHLVELYEDRMARVDCDPENVEERVRSVLASGPAGDDAASVLVAFPRFSRSQVVVMAMESTLIPAGITRHVIQHGRALRVNLPLELLAGATTSGRPAASTDGLEGANRALQRHLSRLQPRFYREPTILYDS
jgi:hypothetical protein